MFSGKTYLNAIHKTGCHPIDCGAIAQIFGFDEPSPVLALGLGTYNAMFFAYNEILIGAKMGFSNPNRTVLILCSLGFDLNAFKFLRCKIMG